MNITDPKIRRYIYATILGAIPLLLAYGVIGGEQVQAWTNFAAALLGIPAAGLALPNTPDVRHEA